MNHAVFLIKRPCRESRRSPAFLNAVKKLENKKPDGSFCTALNHSSIPYGIGIAIFFKWFLARRLGEFDELAKKEEKMQNVMDGFFPLFDSYKDERSLEEEEDLKGEYEKLYEEFFNKNLLVINLMINQGSREKDLDLTTAIRAKEQASNAFRQCTDKFEEIKKIHNKLILILRQVKEIGNLQICPKKINKMNESIRRWKAIRGNGKENEERVQTNVQNKYSLGVGE